MIAWGDKAKTGASKSGLELEDVRPDRHSVTSFICLIPLPFIQLSSYPSLRIVMQQKRRKVSKVNGSTSTNIITQPDSPLLSLPQDILIIIMRLTSIEEKKRLRLTSKLLLMSCINLVKICFVIGSSSETTSFIRGSVIILLYLMIIYRYSSKIPTFWCINLLLRCKCNQANLEEVIVCFLLFFIFHIWFSLSTEEKIEELCFSRGISTTPDHLPPNLKKLEIERSSRDEASRIEYFYTNVLSKATKLQTLVLDMVSFFVLNYGNHNQQFSRSEKRNSRSRCPIFQVLYKI